MKKTKNPRVFLIDDVNDDIRSLVNGRDYIGIVIHNSDYRPDRHQAFEIDQWHVKRFGPKGIGYSFVVEKDGTIYATGRMVKNQSFAQCKGKVQRGDKWERINKVYLGICFSGNGVLQELTLEQRMFGFELIHHIAKYCDVDQHGVHTHAVLQGNKVCPGYLFEKYMHHFHDAIEDGVRMR